MDGVGSSPFSSLMEEDNALESSYHPSFDCAVCLDILFKPVVLACGHTSCFWCVHRAMHGLGPSHCPICRQRYIHFPSICQVLHVLVSKMEPVAYKRREKEVLEEEKRWHVFSPQFNSLDPKNVSCDDNGSGAVRNAVDSFVNHENIRTNISEEVSLQNHCSNNDICKDVICTLCQELLFQPTVLNCGHVFCESCLAKIGSEILICPICQSIHPEEFPKICSVLDHILEEQFPNEYATKRERLKQLEKVNLPSGRPSPSVSRTDGHGWLDVSKANVGVGCDSCGVYPITGKRYKCKDCKEKIGFDLCEACYNTSSKLPGRFNQQHKPDHQFELDDSQMLRAVLRSMAEEPDHLRVVLRSMAEEPDQAEDIFEAHFSFVEADQNAGAVASNENVDSTDFSENESTGRR